MTATSSAWGWHTRQSGRQGAFSLKAVAQTHTESARLPTSAGCDTRGTSLGLTQRVHHKHKRSIRNARWNKFFLPRHLFPCRMSHISSLALSLPLLSEPLSLTRSAVPNPVGDAAAVSIKRAEGTPPDATLTARYCFQDVTVLSPSHSSSASRWLSAHTSAARTASSNFCMFPR